MVAVGRFLDFHSSVLDILVQHIRCVGGVDFLSAELDAVIDRHIAAAHDVHRALGSDYLLCIAVVVGRCFGRGGHFHASQFATSDFQLLGDAEVARHDSKRFSLYAGHLGRHIDKAQQIVCIDVCVGACQGERGFRPVYL